jgi:hypothetical protein
MNVKVGAGPLTAIAEVVESKVFIKVAFHNVASNKLSRSAFTSILSVNGNSISAVNPEFLLLGVKAA